MDFFDILLARKLSGGSGGGGGGGGATIPTCQVSIENTTGSTQYLTAIEMINGEPFLRSYVLAQSNVAVFDCIVFNDNFGVHPTQINGLGLGTYSIMADNEVNCEFDFDGNTVYVIDPTQPSSVTLTLYGDS